MISVEGSSRIPPGRRGPPSGSGRALHDARCQRLTTLSVEREDTLRFSCHGGTCSQRSVKGCDLPIHHPIPIDGFVNSRRSLSSEMTIRKLAPIRNTVGCRQCKIPSTIGAMWWGLGPLRPSHQVDAGAVPERTLGNDVRQGTTLRTRVLTPRVPNLCLTSGAIIPYERYEPRLLPGKHAFLSPNSSGEVAHEKVLRRCVTPGSPADNQSGPSGSGWRASPQVLS